MATKKTAVAKKPVAKKVAKAPVKTAKKPVKAAAKAKKAPMVPTVDTFKKAGNGKLKAVAPKAVKVVVKVVQSRPSKAKMDAIKKVVAKKVAAKAPAKKPVATKAKAKKSK